MEKENGTKSTAGRSGALGLAAVLAPIAILVGTVAFASPGSVPWLKPPKSEEAPAAVTPSTWSQWTTAPRSVELFTAQPGNITDKESIFPVKGQNVFFASPTAYKAADITSECDLPVVTPFASTVVATKPTDDFDRLNNLPETRPGVTVTLKAGGAHFFFSHLKSVSVKPGDTLTPGTQIGLTGQSGNLADGRCRTRLGLSPAECKDADYRLLQGVIDPIPYMLRWQSGEASDPSDELKAWLEEHKCG